MDAVQRMRAKAQGTGNLKTSSQQVVETQTVSGGATGGSRQVIEIQQANPETVYVPSYDSTVVYGAAPAAYPYYPYTYPGYYAGMALAWGGAIAWGAANWGDHWGDCNWGGGDVNINNNNNFNKNNNFNRNNISNRPGSGNRPGQGGGKWQHNPAHRGNAPYGDRGTANKFGGRTQGQQRPGQGNRPGGGQGNLGAGNRPGGGGAGARPGGGAGS